MTLSQQLRSAHPDEFNEILLEAMQDVDFIGQLDIDEAAFVDMTTRMLERHSEMGLRKHSLPHALFLTSMVFCARYSSEDSRKFWEPYARIWKQTSDAKFKRWCRYQFKLSTQDLSKQFEFDFPRRRDGEIVRPVYYHALIPAHLKDDFARWLADRIHDFMSMNEDELEQDLSDKKRYIAPTLESFITNQDTKPAALALIREMIDAVEIFQGGEDSDVVREYLRGIIEREIWDELFPILPSEKSSQSRKRRPKVEWVWDLERSELQLRVRNVLAGSDCKPHQIVLRAPGESVKLRERVYPAWHDEAQQWIIDDHVLDDIDDEFIGDQILVLDQEEQSVFEGIVPPLPADDVVIFRITQQRAYAIPIPFPNSLQDGEWVVLSKAETLLDAELEEIDKPDLLEDAYAQAQRGDIQFPVTIMRSNSELVTIKRQDRSIRANLVGQNLDGLSKRLSPVFVSDEVQLLVTGSQQNLRKRTLEIRLDGRIFRRLRLTEVDLAERGGDFAIDLQPFIRDHSGAFMIDLKGSRGGSALDSPLQFNLLPNLQVIEYPDHEIVYHPDNLPQVTLRGLELQDIDVSDDMIITKCGDRCVQITWADLEKATCSLSVRGARFGWDIERVWAWLDNNDESPIDQLSDVIDAKLHIRGLRSQEAVVGVNDQTTPVQLNAKGHYDGVIQDSTLSDLLRKCDPNDVRIAITIGDITWVLWESLGEIEVEQANIAYDWYLNTIGGTLKLSRPIKGRFDYQLYSSGRQIKSGHWITSQPQSEIELDIPVKLKFGSYSLSIQCNGAPVVNADDQKFTVENPVRWRIIRGGKPDSHAKLELLSSHRDLFAEISDDKLTSYWRRLKFLVTARNWSKLLPAWAVTTKPLVFNIIATGGTKRVIIYPEFALDQGVRGKGKMPITTEDDISTYAYAEWEPNGRMIMLSLRLQTERLDSYWDQDPDDMYPVYFSQLEQRFYARHGYPSQSEMETLQLKELGHQDDLECQMYPGSGELKHTFRPHYLVDRRYFIAQLFGDNHHKSRKEDAGRYRKTIDDFLKREQVYRTQVEDFLDPNSQHRRRLEGFGAILESGRGIGNRTLCRVSQRFIRDALTWTDGVEHEYLALERLVFLLALALRLHANYPQIRNELNTYFPATEMMEMIELVERIAPKLFEWSLTWIELFAIHAISE